MLDKPPPYETQFILFQQWLGELDNGFVCLVPFFSSPVLRSFHGLVVKTTSHHARGAGQSRHLLGKGSRTRILAILVEEVLIVLFYSIDFKEVDSRVTTLCNDNDDDDEEEYF
jgi:hypothetical protein